MVETPTTDATGAQGFNATPNGETQTTRWTYDAKNLPTTIVELEGSTETGRWEMVYNATGDLTGITHVTSGTVATLMPQGDGSSLITEIIGELEEPPAGASIASSGAPRMVGIAKFGSPKGIELPNWAKTKATIKEAVEMCGKVAKEIVKKGNCFFKLDPESLKKPGCCSWDQWRKLQNQKDLACNRDRSCKKQGLSQDEIRIRISNGRECVAARENVMNTCFLGGNKKHREERDLAQDLVIECELKLQ